MAEKMEIFETIKTRRSAREYKPDDVADDLIKRVIDAARWSPSAANAQPVEFVIVKDGERRKKIANLCGHGAFIADAPVAIVACVDVKRSERKLGGIGRELCIHDCAASMQNLLLSAHALGLGTCWVGVFNEKKLKELIGIPEHVRIVAITPLGYPEKVPKTPERRELGDIMHKESW
jgi:nitroreductase